MNDINKNWDIIGHSDQLSYLDTILKNKNYAHTYIFSGTSNIGKEAILLQFISKILGKDFASFEELNKKYLDFYLLDRQEDKKDISISQVRELIKKLYLTGFTDGYSIVVIRDAQNLNTPSSNALLKLLEEPNKNTIIFLVTNNSDFLLPTIQSRAVNIQFNLVDENEIYNFLKLNKSVNDASQLKLITKLSFGRPGKAIEYLHNSVKFAKIKATIEQVIDILNEPLYKRFAFLNTIEDTEEFVEILNLIFRDLILIDNNLSDLMLYDFAKEKLLKLNSKIQTETKTKILKELVEYKNAQEYNVNKLLFLENIILNI